MKKKFSVLALAFAVATQVPANATSLLSGTKGTTFSAFDQSTQGTFLASTSSAAQGLTFAGITNVGVYRNVLGTLDFYYQFQRTGAGTVASDAIETITGSSFAGFLVDAMFSDADPDAGGVFAASTNPGAPATAQRNASGSVVGIDFASANPVADQETSATYIFRTDATTYLPGTYGVIDGSTISGVGYQPAAAVPEAATWMMMVFGFGGLGAVMRGQRRKSGFAGEPFRTPIN